MRNWASDLNCNERLLLNVKARLVGCFGIQDHHGQDTSNVGCRETSDVLFPRSIHYVSNILFYNLYNFLSSQLVMRRNVEGT